VEAELKTELLEEVQHAELQPAVEPAPPEVEPYEVAIPEVPVQAVANQLGDVAVDSAKLVELQMRLFEVELRQTMRNLTQPFAVLAGTGLVALASSILLLFAVATGLHELTGMPLSIAQLLMAAIGVGGAARAAYYAM